MTDIDPPLDFPEVEEISKYHELLYSPYSDLRVFNRTSDNLSIVGILLQESDDSFLVGLPVKLTSGTGTDDIQVQYYVPFPYVRFLKNNIAEVTPVFGVFEKMYLPYLKNTALIEYPEYSDFLPDDIFDTLADIEDENAFEEGIEERLVLAASKGAIITPNKAIH